MIIIRKYLCFLILAIFSFASSSCKTKSIRQNINAAGKDSVKPSLSHSPNVFLINDSFRVPQLNTTTEVWIYLPKGYEESKKSYPVFYVPGGDHFFSEDTINSDWKVDETMDSIIASGKPPAIIVAVKHFQKDSIEEIQTIKFFKETLKPFIDSAYRTDKEETVIAGARNYAGVALYATLKYPETFKKAGVFSPRNRIFEVLKRNGLTGSGYKGMIFFYGGKNDKNMISLADKIVANSNSYIYLIDKQNPKRHESPLGGWFPEFYYWVLSNGHNYIIKPKR
ncbi:MAG: alpha/beta hydrolase-fold protein [Ferruginibacter sp.]